MGFWQDWQYKHFVKAHSDLRLEMELLFPWSELIDPGYGGIVVGFDTMPDWMDFLHLITLDNSDKHLTHENEVHFRLLLLPNRQSNLQKGRQQSIPTDQAAWDGAGAVEGDRCHEQDAHDRALSRLGHQRERGVVG